MHSSVTHRAVLLLASVLMVVSTGCQRDAQAPQQTHFPDRAGEVVPAEAQSHIALPRSSAIVPASADSTAAVITRQGIWVGGQKVVDVPVPEGEIAGGEAGFLIRPLLEALESTVDEPSGGRSPTSPAPTRLALALDEAVGYELLGRVLYTAGQAGMYAFEMLVLGRQRHHARAIRMRLPRTAFCPDSRPIRWLGHLGHYQVVDSSPPDRIKMPSDGQPPSDSGTDDGGRGAGSRCNGGDDLRDRLLEPGPLNLTVEITPTGFRAGAAGAILPTQEGCPPTGPTFCLRDQTIDVEEKIAQVRELAERDDADSRARRSRLLREIEAAYNWRALYNKLVELKGEYPKRTVIKVAATPEIPYRLIVRTMDVARYRLNRDAYQDREALRTALWQEPVPETTRGNMVVQRALFSDPILSLVK